VIREDDGFNAIIFYPTLHKAPNDWDFIRPPKAVIRSAKRELGSSFELSVSKYKENKMSIEWCGVIKSDTFSKNERSIRKDLEQVIKTHKWDEVFTIFEKRPDLINAALLDNSSWYAPIHQLTAENSPIEVIEKLINMGAWRTFKTSDGYKAIDIANKKEYQHLANLLEPVYRHTANIQLLSKIQKHFHQVIIGRIKVISEWQSFRLPDLEILLEIEEPSMWFPVPGMYGGFNYLLVFKGKTVKLISESWSRVVGGSGERHEITSKGSKLVEEGFV
jgi:hypothetical protein